MMGSAAMTATYRPFGLVISPRSPDATGSILGDQVRNMAPARRYCQRADPSVGSSPVIVSLVRRMGPAAPPAMSRKSSTSFTHVFCAPKDVG